MNILVTSGNIPQFIDDVYYLESVGNNKLGSVVTEELSRHKNVDKIFFLHSENSNTPYSSSSSYAQKFFLEEWAEKIMLKEVGSVGELEDAIETIAKENQIDLVLHLMSIPNYRSENVYLLQNEADAYYLMQQIADDFNLSMELPEPTVPRTDTNNTIQSGFEHLYIHQKPSKKVLKRIQELFPDSVIFSSKIRNYPSSDELVQGAKASLQKNASHLVIALDLYESKKSYQDVSYVVYGNNNSKRFSSFEELSEFIYTEWIAK